MSFGAVQRGCSVSYPGSHASCTVSWDDSDLEFYPDRLTRDTSANQEQFRRSKCTGTKQVGGRSAKRTLRLLEIGGYFGSSAAHCRHLRSFPRRALRSWARPHAADG